MFSDQLKLATLVRGIGAPNSAYFNFLYGHNHIGTADLVGKNQDHQGYVFFTKTNCNLSAGNIAGVRKLQNLLDQDPNSLACAVRCMLMPKRMTKGLPSESGAATEGTRCPAINDNYPFIPFLSSSLEGLSGWVDETVDFFLSAEGHAKQIYGFADFRPAFYGTFDLNASFYNREGDPHMAMFTALREYMGAAATGAINPWPESEGEFEIDSNIGIFVFLTDKNKKYVQKAASTIASLGGLPTGAGFNFNSESIFNQENDRVNIPFKCFGVRYNDPIILDNFNKLVRRFNPRMAAVQNRGRDAPESNWGYYRGVRTLTNGSLVKIPETMRFEMNWKGYPYLNPNTSEMEWWIEKQTFDSFLNIIEEEDV